jgi:hypothetical protein
VLPVSFTRWSQATGICSDEEAQLMRNILIFGLLLMILVPAGCTSKIGPEEEAVAVDGAKQWLALIDAEDYQAGWRQAAAFLKEKVSEDQWVKSMTTVRKPMGTVASRKVKATQFRTMMAQALRGEYLVIEFQTTFAHSTSLTESVTQMREKDGVWRVGGYHLN